MENQPDNKKNSRVVHFTLIGVLILLSIILAFLLIENQNLKEAIADCSQQTDVVRQEKQEVMQNLQQLALEYDSMMTDNDSINAELIAQKEKIDKLMADAKKYNWSIYKLKKEAETLREIMKGYVRTIDSLNMENIELRAENIQVLNQLGQIESQNKNLMKDKKQLEDKVRLGAKLEAINMIVIAQRVKKNNVHKQVSRADKAQKIKVCFTLSDNEVTESGKKMIYLRIISPDGTVLSERTDNAHTFTFEGTTGLFSVKKEVYYENKSLDLCMYWDVVYPLKPGEYIIKAYENEQEIGSSTLILK